MDKREKCKEIMLRYFGPASARSVDSMTDEEVVAKCRAKIKGFFGDEKAKEFDTIS